MGETTTLVSVPCGCEIVGVPGESVGDSFLRVVGCKDHPKAQGIKEGNARAIVNYIRNLETELSEMARRFSCVLEHATGGRMSKTNIIMEQMRSEIDDYQQEFFEGLPVEFAKVEKELNEKIGLLRRDLAEWLQLARRQYAEMNRNDGICPTLKGINETEVLLNVELTDAGVSDETE